MAIDERARHEMYLKLEQALGAEAAGTLMEHLPPVGWADVATKRDLEHLAELNKREYEALRLEFKSGHEALRLEFKADLKDAIQAQTFRLMTFMSMLFIALATLAFGAAHLT